MFRNAAIATCFLFGVFLFLSCGNNRSPWDKIQNTPARHLNNYNFDKRSSYSQRLNVSEEIVLDYLRDIDGDPGYSFYYPNREEIDELEAYFNLLPPYVGAVCKKRLIGIYFVNGFYGSGLTDFVLDERGEIYTILVLNPKVLQVSISELFTYKDKSCFDWENSNMDLKIDISDEYSGLLYILLHETAHIVDYVDRKTPYVLPAMKELAYENENGSPFIDQFWKDYREPADFITFSSRSQLKFYSDNKEDLLNDGELVKVYNELKESPFCSLYSSINWAEDYAEYFALHHLTQNLNCNYKISIEEKGTKIFEYSPFKNDIVLSRVHKMDIF